MTAESQFLPFVVDGVKKNLTKVFGPKADQHLKLLDVLVTGNIVTELVPINSHGHLCMFSSTTKSADRSVEFGPCVRVEFTESLESRITFVASKSESIGRRVFIEFVQCSPEDAIPFASEMVRRLRKV